MANRTTSKPSQAYKGNGQHRWEDVCAPSDSTQNGMTSRLRVPGGWIYSVYHGPTDGETALFVPMPAVVKHEV